MARDNLFRVRLIQSREQEFSLSTSTILTAANRRSPASIPNATIDNNLILPTHLIIMSVILDLKTLHEIDEIIWLQETIKVLKDKQFVALDLENLIEELEDLGSEKRHQVESLLEQIIRHLLLLQYWRTERNYNEGHWRSEISVFRNQLKRKLTTNLRNHLASQMDKLYQDALEAAQEKTLGSVNFPAQCPYTLEQILTSKWLPEYQN